MSETKQYTAENILVHPATWSDDPGLVLTVTPEDAGWDYISFQVRRLDAGESWSFASGENELAIVNLTGVYTVTSNRGEWHGIGGRASV
ncbi:MAG: 5-deoxy-glucuronate isomerase, partial [Caldilineaceae bacterium]|nr:5-deoxy-glucuronate isomerase [Caldilineaceae bacterium]